MNFTTCHRCSFVKGGGGKSANCYSESYINENDVHERYLKLFRRRIIFLWAMHAASWSIWSKSGCLSHLHLHHCVALWGFSRCTMSWAECGAVVCLCVRGDFARVSCLTSFHWLSNRKCSGCKYVFYIYCNVMYSGNQVVIEKQNRIIFLYIVIKTWLKNTEMLVVFKQ